MSEKIFCQATGKELSGYEGDLQIDPVLDNECRILELHDFKIQVLEDMDWETVLYDIQGEGEWSESYPDISVSIESPYSDEPTIIRLCEELEPASGGICLEDLEPGEHFFEKIEIDCSSGKYRGYMEIDFSNIDDKDDLLEAVLQELYEEHEWGLSCYGSTRAWITGKHEKNIKP